MLAGGFRFLHFDTRLEEHKSALELPRYTESAMIYQEVVNTIETQEAQQARRPRGGKCFGDLAPPSKVLHRVKLASKSLYRELDVNLRARRYIARGVQHTRKGA